MNVNAELSLKSLGYICVMFDCFDYLTVKFLIFGEIEYQYKDSAYTKTSGIWDILDILERRSLGHQGYYVNRNIGH